MAQGEKQGDRVDAEGPEIFAEHDLDVACGEGQEQLIRPLPPFFASVGTRDPLFRCSKRLKAALDRLGTECELHVSPGEIHGYDAMVWRPRAREKWIAAGAFLDRHLAASARDEGRDVRAAV